MNNYLERERETQIAQVDMIGLKELLYAIIDAVIVPLLIYGGPGIGKSAMIRLVASELGSKLISFNDPGFGAERYGFIDFRLANYDATDLKGFPYVNDVEKYSEWLGSKFFPTEKNIAAGRVPANGACALEEIGLANDDVRKSVFQILQERELNGEKIGDGWTFVATSNRREDKSGAQALQAALINRLAIVELQCTLDDFVIYSRESQNIWPPIVAFFKFRPHLLNNFDPLNWKINSPFSTPRSIENMSRLILNWVESEADEGDEGLVRIPPVILSKVTVGPVVADEFTAFLEVYDKIPHPDDVLRDPENQIVPTEPAELWAITTALAERADLETVTPIFTYLKRCPPDFEVATFREMNKTSNSLFTSTDEFVEHSQRYPEIYTAVLS